MMENQSSIMNSSSIDQQQHHHHQQSDGNSGLLSYLVRMTTYPFTGRAVPPPKKFIDLNSYCLSHIFRNLNFRDLIKLRATCRHIRDAVDEYLEATHSFTYDCHLNGIELSAGCYRFNTIAFQYALSRMPMLVSLKFERCHIMKNILANCHFNLLSIIAENGRQLHELHLTRSIFINSDSLSQFATYVPRLTHLSIEIFDERQLETILVSFPRLQYLNLSNSVLYNISTILKQHIHPRIRTLILPKDLKNEKFNIIQALGTGNGKKLQRLEMQITISDLNEDKRFFDELSNQLPALEWLQFEIQYDGPPHILHCSSDAQNNGVENSEDSGVQSPVNDCHSVHSCLHRSDLIAGLSKLTKLRILILSEGDHYDSSRECSLFTDDSMIPIIKNCLQLRMLSIACGLCRNSTNYAPKKLYSKTEARILNYILFNISNEQYETQTQSPIMSKAKYQSNRFMERQESVLESDEDDPNSYVSIDSWPHRIGDSSLGLLDQYLPDLRILHLRGIRLGPKTMKSVGRLSQLEHLRINSVRCFSNNDDEAQLFANFMNFIARSRNRTNIRISNIAFL